MSSAYLFAHSAEPPDYELPDDSLYCPICGASLEWEDCWDCGGDGYIDETEYDPLEGDDDMPCPTCHAEGGWHVCPHTGEPEHRRVPDGAREAE